MEEDAADPMDLGPARRHLSEPIARPARWSQTPASRLRDASDHLLALLQREASDYSEPLPAAYYPGEFAEAGEGGRHGTAHAAGLKKRPTSLGFSPKPRV